MSAAKPFIKFFPTDWQADQMLRLCSVAARGLWIEMLCLMHKADRYGHLLINGVPPTDTQLAVLTATPTHSLPDLIGELEAAGVFSRTSKGVIYSRRLVRDEKKAKTAQENGKKGGNATLCKTKKNRRWDNPPLNPTLKGGDKPHIPEAIFQNNPPTPQGGTGRGKNGEDYAFNGKVIRLNAKDYKELEDMYGGNYDQFYDCLASRDDWYAEQPPEKRKNWFIATRKYFENLSTH